MSYCSGHFDNKSVQHPNEAIPDVFQGYIAKRGQGCFEDAVNTEAVARLPVVKRFQLPMANLWGQTVVNTLRPQARNLGYMYSNCFSAVSVMVWGR